MEHIQIQVCRLKYIYHIHLPIIHSYWGYFEESPFYPSFFSAFFFPLSELEETLLFQFQKSSPIKTNCRIDTFRIIFHLKSSQCGSYVLLA